MLRTLAALGGAVAVVLGGLMVTLILLVSLLVTPPEEGAQDAEPTCTPQDGAQSVQVPDEYQALIDAAAQESQLNADVIAAQIQAESGWDPGAVSSVGAQGIAQFMPGTWDAFGEGGDPFDPNDAIPAQGRYMKYLREFMEPYADGEEHLVKLVLAGYNAGEGAVQRFDFDLDRMFDGQYSETRNYVDNITAAIGGNYTSDCEHSGAGEGDVVDTAGTLAWDEKVVLPRSTAGNHGREESKPEFVTAADELSKNRHTAYYTDCGVYVAAVMISSGADPDFPPRGTRVQLPYMQNSDKYEFFTPQSEADLEPGDILIVPGHIYIYTGERHAGTDGRAQGASLYTRPPSGHNFFLNDGRGAYQAGRLKG